MLEHVSSSSKVGVVRLRMLARKLSNPAPISDAQSIGTLDQKSGLILGPRDVLGLKVHRAADAHFEGRKDVTWVHMTMTDRETKTKICTDIPVLSHAAEEYRLCTVDAKARSAEIAGWLDDLVDGT